MADYEGYIKELKKIEPKADYQKMHLAINSKIKHQPRKFFGTSLALAGCLAAAVIGLMVYFGDISFMPSGNGLLSEYVFQQEQDNSSSNILISYVYQN